MEEVPEAANAEAGLAVQTPSTTEFAEPLDEEPLELTDLTGKTRGEQIKNALAAIGIVAIAFHGIRIYNALQVEPPKRRRRRRR